MKLKIASWNIAGGHTIKSLGHFDYQKEHIDYFIGELRDLNPDIVLFQESHTSLDGKNIIAKKIAEQLGFANVYNSPASPSHIDSEYLLGTAAISHLEFKRATTVLFPDPEVPLFWKDGSPAVTHHKNLQILDFGEFTVANMQMLPVSLFGYTYDDKSYGGKLAQQINKILADNLKFEKLIVCGDFNFNNPSAIYPILEKLQLVDILPDETTRPSLDSQKKTPDHIYISKGIRKEKTEIIKTHTDHYLCYAEISLEEK